MYVFTHTMAGSVSKGDVVMLDDGLFRVESIRFHDHVVELVVVAPSTGPEQHRFTMELSSDFLIMVREQRG